MFRPEPMPAGVAADPAEELDTSCLHCFSRRVGLISIVWILLVMNAIDVFSTIEVMTLERGGAIAIFVIFLLVQLVDVVLDALLLLGIRDGVVRTRLNIWIVWNVGYSCLLLLLFIIFVAAVSGVTAGVGILSGIRLLLVIALRIYGCFAGWKFRESIMSAPPPSNQRRPDGTNTAQPSYYPSADP